MVFTPSVLGTSLGILVFTPPATHTFLQLFRYTPSYDRPADVNRLFAPSKVVAPMLPQMF